MVVNCGIEVGARLPSFNFMDKNFLLSVSHELACVKTRKQLLKAITDLLQPELGFTHSTIFLVNEYRTSAGHHWVAVINEDQLTMTSFLQEPASRAKDHPRYQHAIRAKYPINDGIFNKVLLSKEPQVFDLDQLSARSNMPEYMQILFESGIRKIVMIGLQIGDRIMGVWAICLVSNQQMSFDQLTLVRGISYQLSTAVSNILANEEILRREKERELLLSLSIDFAAVRNTNELLLVITRKLKTLLGFSHSTIAIINDDQVTASAFLLDPESKTKTHPTYHDVINDKHPINDGILNRIVASAAPIVVDLDQLIKESVLPTWLKVNFESGIRQLAAVRFSKGSRAFGFWLIYFEEKIPKEDSRLSLAESLANQISIAVSNIVANEEVSKREEEKSTLLSFSNAIATVRDKKGLGLVIKQYLKNLFGVREYLITIKNDDQETYSYFIHDLETDSPTDEGFQLITGVRMPIAGSMTGEVLRSEVPVIFDLADIRRKAHLSFPSASFWRSAGAERVLGVRLKVAKEDIGILWIQPGLITDHLLQGITAQMAIALANAIANDRIERQLIEINQYKRQLEEEKIYLKEEIETAHNYSEIVGDSPTMKKIFHMVSQVAPSDSTVLILGETGTGKELIARAIHNSSPRRNKLMVKVNCAALPANLIESELFGHERGSFTGATDRRIGKFELANGGTLFLDEIGEMPLELQVKLLRALQEREIERVGGRSTIKVDVRIIAATNRDLEKEMGEGRFRSDLYYRLNIFPISLPPLRDRREDIPELASHFIQRFAKKAGRNITALSNSALQELIQYNWPGNIRELEHLIERSILQAPGNTLKHIHLPQPRQSVLPASKESFVVRTIDENERDFIMKTIKYCCGRIAGEGGAAQLLGVPPSTLNSKMKRLGIRREHIS